APGRSILITRAPRSASWRVANGAAIACSSDTTVTPSKGLMIESSPQDRRRVHGQPSFMIPGPELHGVALAGAGAYRKRFKIAQRPDGLELESGYGGLGHFPAQEVEQERGDQRAMDHETRIAFDLGDIAAIVVNAVAIEGECRISKEQYRVGSYLALPRPRLGRQCGRRRGGAGGRCVAIDEIVEFDKRWRGLVVAMNLVPHFHEYQRAAATRFFGDSDDGGAAGDGVTDAKRTREFELAAGPHAPWKRDRRKKAAALGVTVGPDVRLAIDRQKIQPVPQRRQGS